MCAPQVPCGGDAEGRDRTPGSPCTPVSEESSVTDVLGKVTTGQADAGVVYVTDVQGAAGNGHRDRLPPSDNAVNTYPIAVLAGSAEPRPCHSSSWRWSPARRASRCWPTRASARRDADARPAAAAAGPARAGLFAARRRSGRCSSLLPLAAMLTRVDWSQFGSLITSESLSDRAGSEPADLDGRDRRCACVLGVPMALVLARAAFRGPATAALPGAAAAGAAAGGRRASRCSTPSAGTACSGSRLEVARHADRVLHDRGGHGPDVRRAAVPGGQPRGRAAHVRPPLRGRSPPPSAPARPRSCAG